MSNLDPRAPRHTQPPLPLQQPGWRYEGAVGEVEAIIAKIESGELDLAEVFTEFATAVEHLQQCEAFLQQRRQQMELLIEQLGDTSEF